MNEATPSTASGVPALAAGGAAFRLHHDRRATLISIAVLLCGLTCLAVEIYRARWFFDFRLVDPLLFAAFILVPAALILLARPRFALWRLRLRIQRSGGEPWNDPALWNQRAMLMLVPRGRGSTGSGRRILVLAAVAASLLLPLVVVAFAWEVGSFLRPFGLVAAVVPILAVQLALAWMRRRHVRLEVGFASFPCRVGERRAQIQLTFDEPPPAGSKPPVATLQCIAERRDERGWWKYGIANVVPAADVFPVPDTRDAYAVEFDIPGDAPPTDLLTLPAHSWQLVVSVETASGWYDGAVAAPVFAGGAPTAVRP